jgi:hypothetical protein
MYCSIQASFMSEIYQIIAINWDCARQIGCVVTLVKDYNKNKLTYKSFIMIICLKKIKQDDIIAWEVGMV